MYKMYNINNIINNINPLNRELNPIGHLLALLGGATIVVVSRLRVNINVQNMDTDCHRGMLTKYS